VSHPYRRWAKGADAALLDGIGSGWSYDRIARELERTRASVMHRWYVLRRTTGGVPDQSARTIARLLGTSESVVGDWIKRGWIRAHRNTSGAWVITNDALDAFFRDPQHWARWEPGCITDPAWRDHASACREPLLTTAQVAARIGYTPSGINRLVAHGRLRSFRGGCPGTGGTRSLFREVEVAAFLRGEPLPPLPQAPDATEVSQANAPFVCLHCGSPFERPHTTGRPPAYCKPSCRTMAAVRRKTLGEAA
jgi:hypothetical protein